MNKLIVTILATTLIACGGRSVEKECVVEKLGRVTAEQPINCEAFAQNYAFALSLLIESKLITAEEVPEVFGDVSVHIRSTLRWDTFDGRNVDGYYTWTGAIELGRDGTALLHEMLHRIKASRNVLEGGSHERWDEEGLNVLDSLYTYNSELVALE